MQKGLFDKEVIIKKKVSELELSLKDYDKKNLSGTK